MKRVLTTTTQRLIDDYPVKASVTLKESCQGPNVGQFLYTVDNQLHSSPTKHIVVYFKTLLEASQAFLDSEVEDIRIVKSDTDGNDYSVFTDVECKFEK